ncbi:peptide ABC transporter substrate-binding protein [Pandoraea terrae]|uniref:Peptide ABC transporter substrate-binding protein n=1 Tax=Pandoraea terrae TaxID=1537710 RepID=A0A5E4WKS2_9BURK|nr:ABC transporter substrate-binding protein [Pandoraea terrae]VVE23615.1 peptide ABC transporter substrate-binding protein [Pandoraea terrae]
MRRHVLAAALLVPFALAANVVHAKALTVCTEASPEGFDVVRYNSLTTTNASADPVFNRLVEFDAGKAAVVPSLAERWEISPDGLTYTFTLRKNVAFHANADFKPTRPLGADDVVFTFERMLDTNQPWHKLTPSGFPHAQSLSLGKLIKSVQKVDAQTVRFTLSEPEATFLSTLTMGFASIYSAEYAAQLLASNKTDQLNARPIGTGPFAFRRYQKDSLVRFDANPAYFGGKPSIDTLIYAIVPDAAVRAQKVKAGECQIALSPKPLDVKAARGEKSLKVVEAPAFMTAFVAINAQHKPLDDKRVRQALNLAFDKSSYVNNVFEGTATPAVNPYPPNTWSYAKRVADYPLDIVRAKKMLADAGFPNGFETTIWTRPTGSLLNPNPRVGAEMLQNDLAKIGVRASIRTIEWGELIRRGKAGEHDLLFMGWSGDNGDPDNFLTPQFSCAAVTSGTNFARFCDTGLDKLIADGKRTSDVATRTTRYEAAQKMIKDDALWIPLAHPTAVVITRANITGYAVSPFGRQNFAGVQVK